MNKAKITGPVMDKAEIVRLAVEASKEYDAKQRIKNKKLQHEWKLRNTRLLLNHYNYFKDHINESIYSSDHLQAIDIIAEIEECNASIDIKAIKKSAQKTFVIMSHVDSMLELYQAWCEKSGEIEQRRYRVLRMFYFDRLQIPDILQAEFISEKTCYRDIDNAVSKLSSLIFGIEAIHQMTE